MNSNSKVKQSFLLIVLAGIMWGTSGVFVHYLTPYGFSSLQMTAARGSISFICMAVFLLIKDKRLFCVKPKELLLFLFMGCSLFFAAYCYYTSIQLTSVSTAVMLLGMAPVYVIAFSAVFFHEKLSKLKLISVIGILAGGVLVSGVIGESKFAVGGVLMGVASGIAYGAYSVLAKISAKSNCHPLSATLYGFLTMAVIALCVANPAEAIHLAAKTPNPTVPLLIGLGIVTYILPYTLYTISFQHISAGTASALGIIEPLAATLFSLFLFHEELTVFSTVGIIFILVSVVLLGKDTTNESPTV